MKNSKERITAESITIIAFLVLFAGILITFQALEPSFLGVRSLSTMLKTGASIAIAALGLTFVIIVNHSDISFYMSCCFSGMFMAWLIAKGLHPVIAIFGGLVAGAAWGSVSGFAVGKLKLPDIITTIAIGSIAFGCAYVFSDGSFIFDNFMTSGITNLSEFQILGVTVSVYIMLVLYIFAFIVLEKSKYGRNFYAVGANKKSAFFSGIQVNKYIIIAFIISGTLAALAAMITNASQGSGNVKSGLNLLMPCFSAIYIGWSVFRKPCVIGTLLGAFLATVITTGFTVLSIPYYYSNLTQAGILIFSIALSKMDFSKTTSIKKVKEVKA